MHSGTISCFLMLYKPMFLPHRRESCANTIFSCWKLGHFRRYLHLDSFCCSFQPTFYWNKPWPRDFHCLEMLLLLSIILFSQGFRALNPCKGKFQFFDDCGTPPLPNPLMLILYDSHTQNTPLCQLWSRSVTFSLSYQRFCRFRQCAFGVSRYFSTG